MYKFFFKLFSFGSVPGESVVRKLVKNIREEQAADIVPIAGFVGICIMN